MEEDEEELGLCEECGKEVPLKELDRNAGICAQCCLK